MHARFQRINAVGPFEMEVLGFQGAEEALNRRVVEAVFHIELGDIDRSLLVRRGRVEVVLQNVGHMRTLMPGTCRERLFVRINTRSPIFCIRRCTHLWSTGSAIELHRAAVIRRYPRADLLLGH